MFFPLRLARESIYLSDTRKLKDYYPDVFMTLVKILIRSLVALALRAT
jgi:hypothetical protein